MRYFLILAVSLLSKNRPIQTPHNYVLSVEGLGVKKAVVLR
jgi:hypothetical protein